MNYCWFIVRIIKDPIQTYFEENISLVEMSGEFRQKPSRQMSLQVRDLNILFWADNIDAENILKCCKIHDYILIYGQISVIKRRAVEISVTKIIPIFHSRVSSTR